MFRQCDFQQDDLVIRGWIPERKAVKDSVLQVGNKRGNWTIIRTHGYNPVDEGFIELSVQFLKKTLS
jgi:hypothetical protein